MCSLAAGRLCRHGSDPRGDVKWPGTTHLLPGGGSRDLQCGAAENL